MSSYSTRPGRLVSYLTGRSYPFTLDRDGAARRAAEAQLSADDRAYQSAMQSRAGRQVSSRELMAGRPTETDLRSVREKVEQDGHTTATPPAPSNPWAKALESTRKLIARTREEKNRKQARLNMYEARAAEWESQRQREAEHAEVMARPDVQMALGHAQKRIDAILLDGAATQDEIDAAKLRLSSLQASGDVTSYQADTRSADAAKLDRLRAERETAEKTLADLRAAVMAGEVSLDSLPAPAPTPA